MLDVVWQGEVSLPYAKKRELMDHAIEVVKRYDSAITLRQLYYQLVAANIIPNSKASYDEVGRAVATARKLGLLPFRDIEDRGRQIKASLNFADAGDAVAWVKAIFDQDRWINQEDRVAVVCEKAALSGVIEPICERWQVPYIASKGYASLSLGAEVASKLFGYTILYFGDLDPSGVHMPQNWKEMLDGFGAGCQIIPVALTPDQIDRYDLVPQPVKLTDKRSKSFRDEYGDHCYELDALPPDLLASIVEIAIEVFIDKDRWNERDAEIEAEREKIIASVS